MVDISHVRRMQWKTYEVFTDPGDFFSPFTQYLILMLNLTETITNNEKSHFPQQSLLRKKGLAGERMLKSLSRISLKFQISQQEKEWKPRHSPWIERCLSF